MDGCREKLSGGKSGALLQEELRRVGRDELQRMLRKLKVDQVLIPTGHLLGAKVGIGLNYSQLRKLRRWLKKYGVSMESERLTRRCAAERLTAYDIHAENLPFSVKGRKAEPTKIQPLPCAYVSPVTGAIYDYLEKCQESKCKDGKSYTVRVFATGDYALLCLWYGLSGAAGCHPCLWCDISKEEMKDVDDRRLTIPARTLNSLKEHNTAFATEGRGNPKNAKNFHNAISPAMFTVPIDQVMIPGLHISLGLYLKLFKLLESNLHDLDLKLQTYLSSVLSEGDVTTDALLADANMGKFDINAIDKARALDEEADMLEEKLEEQEDELTWLVVCEGTTRKHAKAVFEEACTMVEEMEQKIESLEDAINDLTSMVATTMTGIMDAYPDLPLSLVPLATKTAGTFKQLFTLFSKCHNGYSHAGPMDERAISELDKAIKEFMLYYRTHVPDGTVPVKMHMLEDHVVPCIRRWGFGLGFMGEQGVEHVHALFNTLARPTCTIPDPVARLKSTLNTHLIGVSPQNIGIP
ncbi:Hypp8401 [Branchiostoma lanceolatum]|uniref:Hypp8401 protein n=1 Tax=Branchiostoma lanceolatum TaxID=7740 RepID=A0A8J9Z873_BRALA|nr:Hypp8401 [Branchiostoma lanceolatum]